MKKIITVLLVLAMLGLVVPAQVDAGTGRGGFMGLVAGCCFGPRAAGDYNEGKDLHWREWLGLIPYVGWVFAVWSGVDGANGVTRAQFAERYGASFY